jgi:hypothetical protein
MRDMTLMLLLAAAMLLVCAPGHAADCDDGGRIKFSFDSLPLLGNSDKSADSASEYVDDTPENERYTYDAMGRKVPVRTDGSGNALH